MTELMPLTRSAKLAYKGMALREIAEDALDGGIPAEAAPEDFPELPTPLEATEEIRKALRTLSQTFNKVTVSDRRTLSTEELAQIGVEYEAIQKVIKLIKTREDQVKEIVRTHQDVEAEEQGQAFPYDITRHGKVIAEATPRDANGHYLLAAKGTPNDLAIPGTTLKFSNQFSSGRTTENLGAIEQMFLNGEITEAAYKEMTITRRVPDADRIKSYVIRTGEVSILSRIVKKGRDSQSLYLRPLKKS